MSQRPGNVTNGRNVIVWVSMLAALGASASAHAGSDNDRKTHRVDAANGVVAAGGGTAACCTPDDTCEDVSEIACAQANGLWQPGRLCGVGAQACPFGACIGAQGDCRQARQALCVGGGEDGQPCDPNEAAFQSACLLAGGTCPGLLGCDNPVCCTNVCVADFSCCQAHWDPTCAAAANQVCFDACGDGFVTAGEECDHGFANSDTFPDACRTDCRNAHCGDGTCDSDEDSCSCAADCGAPIASESFAAVCGDGLDNDCDGLIDSADPDCTTVPTVSQWGLTFFSLLLLAGAKIVFRRGVGLSDRGGSSL